MTNSPRKHETDTKPTKDNNNWFFSVSFVVFRVFRGKPFAARSLAALGMR